MRITEYLTLTAGAIGLAAILAGCGAKNPDSIDQKVKNAPTKGTSDKGYDSPSYDELIERSDEAFEQKNNTLALKIAQQARNLDPSKWEAYANISTAHLRQGDYDSAIRVALKGIDYGSNIAGLYQNIAIAHRRKGDNKSALEFYKKVIKLQPDNRSAQKWVSHLNSH